MRALQVVRSAYRCTVEEQDDPAVWIARAMKKSGAELGVLLRENAVSYALEGQDASGLRFGDRSQTAPPRLGDDLAALASEGAAVYVVREDLVERGISESALVPGMRPVGRSEIPGVFAEYDQVWHW